LQHSNERSKKKANADFSDVKGLLAGEDGSKELRAVKIATVDQRFVLGAMI